MSKPNNAVTGFYFRTVVRDDSGNPILDEDGRWETEFPEQERDENDKLIPFTTKDLKANDDVIFKTVRDYDLYEAQIDEVLMARGLHLASPDAGSDFRVTKAGHLRKWVAPYDAVGRIVIE